MNTAKIKAYAQQARRDFIQAVTEKAHMLGLSKEKIEPAEVKGDYAIIGGRLFLKEIEEPRKRLTNRIQQDGFDLVMRAIAYTWFNRFVALRYMEIHDYLDHGYRVLSNRNESEVPEILEHAAELDLPGLNKDKVVELRLAGDKDNQLYRLLIFAQCDALNRSMPFLFEKINHETELLLPDNLLHSNSPIRKLVNDIDEADWENVEIIGWIYQFYISERKDEVIGKVVKSEDIPAATQLFTPNWIVKYMVQNTLGRQWLATYPESSLRDKMEYYIEPTKQTEDVQKQLAEAAPSSIDPESLTLLDPACGSGHILVEAYDLFKTIYQERGYRKRDIPRLILEKNLYGLEICDRAGQLAGFALMMKARADDRRILNGNSPKLNVMAFQSSAHINAEELSKVLLKEKIIRFKDDDKLFPDFKKQQVLTVKQKPDFKVQDIVRLLDIFKQGKTFGFLITVPKNIALNLNLLKRLLDEKLNNGDLFERLAAEKLTPFLKQALIISRKYDCVVTNPPYMSGKSGMNSLLKTSAAKNFPSSKSDLFSMFVEKSLKHNKKYGYSGFVMPYVWMFITSYEKFRSEIAAHVSITTLIQLEYNSFEPACVPVATFTLQNQINPKYKGEFINLSEFRGHQNQAPKTKEAIKNPNCGYRYSATSVDFKKIPGNPIAYWASQKIRECFDDCIWLKEVANPRQGMATGDNEKFIRFWHEVNYEKIGFGCNSKEKAWLNTNKKWFPYNKGGIFRKWYGNNDNVIAFDKYNYKLLKTMGNRCPSEQYYFQQSITWTMISSSSFGARRSDQGFVFDARGSSAFPPKNKINILTGFLCTNLTSYLLKILSPTISFEVGHISSLPIKRDFFSNIGNEIKIIVENAIKIARADWDSFETSWDFQLLPMLNITFKSPNLEKCFINWQNHCTHQIKRLQQLETENNRLFIEAYGLKDELNPEVSEDQITLARSDRQTDIKRLISYAIGCMMGRYSLDEPGLIYAHSGNNGFDPSRYKTFPADDDGIIPIMDQDWFPDDAANRFTEFLKVSWPPENLEENLRFIAESLKPKSGEMPTDTIRRYLYTNFLKDHLKTYKKRPIYWLFSSGKHKAFECLIYLHRYNESTLSRTRSSYVTPLQGKFNARIDYLRNEIDATAAASARRKLQKEFNLLKKKQAELFAFDDELRHYADMRITLDLDDGVKVNYGKFGNLLAEKKTVTGKK